MQKSPKPRLLHPYMPAPTDSPPPSASSRTSSGIPDQNIEKESMGSRSNRETAGLATARLKFPGNARRSIASEDLRASAETDVGHPGHARPQGRLRSQRRPLETFCA